MDNSARVIAITITPGFIMPCARINRGIDVASRDHGASFYVEITFSWFSGGHPAGPVTHAQTVTSTRYMALLDPMWIRAQGDRVAIPSQPDHGSLVTCTAVVYVNDARGNRINQCDAEVTAILAP